MHVYMCAGIERPIAWTYIKIDMSARVSRKI